MSFKPSPSAPVSPLDRYSLPASPVMGHPVVAEVMAGKRYVIYPYVVSILVMSFKKNMGSLRVVDGGQRPIVPLVVATLVTVTFGWWGFPWGVIWTPAVLFYLWCGGRDLTRQVLADAVGVEDAKKILAIAPKAKLPVSIWLVRLIILVPVMCVASMILGEILSPAH